MTDILHVAPLRTLTSSDSPYAGDLLAGDPPLVRTRAEAWTDNPAWRASGSGHILAPVDLFRGAEASSVLVPHCPRRLSELLGSRSTITPGEAVTLAVSLLRGAAEADALGASVGVWWVTSSGRPVLATVGSAPWRSETVTTLEGLVGDAGPELAGALRGAATIVASPMLLRREGARAEAALFGSAEPEPLLADPLAPVRARTVQIPRGEAATGESVTRDGLVVGLLTRFVEAPLAVRIAALVRRRRDTPRDDRHHSHPVTSPRARDGSPGPTSRRRRPLMLAGGLAVLIIGVGALWPSQDGRSASAGTESDPPVATQTPPVPGLATGSPTASPHHAEKDARPTSLEHAAAELLDRFAACAATGCGPDVVEQPARELPDGPAADSSSDRSLSVVDDYGGVAAIRVGSSPAQIVVIVRVNDTWLVRDIYDVADQP